MKREPLEPQNVKFEKRLTVLESVASAMDVNTQTPIALRRARFNAKALTRQFDAQCEFQLADVSTRIELLLADNVPASAVGNLRKLIALIRISSR